jgi:hypothetical protein
MDSNEVHACDVPLLGMKPQRVDVRVLTVMARLDEANPAWEAVLVVRREAVLVFDFYRFRPETR